MKRLLILLTTALAIAACNRHVRGSTMRTTPCDRDLVILGYNDTQRTYDIIDNGAVVGTIEPHSSARIRLDRGRRPGSLEVRELRIPGRDAGGPRLNVSTLRIVCE